MNEERTPVNVVEAFALYDTIQIGTDVTEQEGYKSFAALAGEEEIPFFSKRTRSNVGLAYTNKDSTDALPFVFFAYSMGVEFLGSTDREAISNPTDELAAEAEGGYIMEKLLPAHTGVTLKVREDERLAGTAEMIPPGYGSVGYTAGAFNQAPIQATTQSWPDLSNRFKFPEPIRIPRNTIVTANLRFSKFAKRLLTYLPAPGGIKLWDPSGEGTAILIPRRAMIRVSLLGKREVQQRGELHV